MPLTCSTKSYEQLLTGDKHHLQELVSVPEAGRVAHRAVREDGANVVMRSDLHSVLHVNCSLQADPQSSPHSSLGHTPDLIHQTLTN